MPPEAPPWPEERGWAGPASNIWPSPTETDWSANRIPREKPISPTNRGRFSLGTGPALNQQWQPHIRASPGIGEKFWPQSARRRQRARNVGWGPPYPAPGHGCAQTADGQETGPDSGGNRGKG